MANAGRRRDEGVISSVAMSAAATAEQPHRQAPWAQQVCPCRSLDFLPISEGFTGGVDVPAGVSWQDMGAVVDDARCAAAAGAHGSNASDTITSRCSAPAKSK